MAELSTEQFCHAIPKVEVHAHLNGSISPKTVQSIIKRNNEDMKLEELVVRDGMSYRDAFEIFGKIHSLVRDVATLKMITEDVIEEFRADNVRYLELRTTPKSVPGTEITKEKYLRAVLDVIAQKSCSASAVLKTCTEEKSPIVVRLLVSIDRGRSIEDAKDTIILVQRFTEDQRYKSLIIGLDLSGNPFAKGLADFLPLLRKQLVGGTYVSVHVGETLNTEENTDLVNLRPNRIGHAVFILPEDGGTEEMTKFILENQIPIEICLTSNLFCGIVEEITNHHFKYWFEKQHPVVLCTDDKGIFNTSVSEEYFKAFHAFKLSREDLVRLTYQSINCTGADATLKDCLRERWRAELDLFGMTELCYPTKSVSTDEQEH